MTVRSRISEGRSASARAASIARPIAVAVVPVDALHVPALRLEALLDVLAEGEIGAAVDRDAVVVVEIDQVAEPEVPGQRGGLGGDALHQVAVARRSPYTKW